MAKKITVTLTEKAEKHFNEVAYSLDKGNGELSTQSEVISHCLEELEMFERLVGEDVTSYIKEHFPEEFESKNKIE